MNSLGLAVVARQQGKAAVAWVVPIPDRESWSFARDDVAYVIQVKENAPELLRLALSRAPLDLVG